MEHLCQQLTLPAFLAELEMLKSSSSGVNPLEPTYNRAMELLRAKDRHCVKLALKVLSWLVNTQRTLTIRELQMAVSIDQNCIVFDQKSLPDPEAILEVCASLVTLDKVTGTIRLAHYTVQEYLLKKSIIPTNANVELALACTTFLSLDIFSQRCTSVSTLDSRFKLHPFLDYAAQYLSFHLKTCDELSSLKVILRFLSSPGNVSSYLQALYAVDRLGYGLHRHFLEYWEDYYLKYPNGQIALHTAATIGHRSAVQRLWQSMEITTLDNIGSAAIYLAEYWQQEGVIEFLHSEGINSIVTGSRDWQTAHKAIVRLMKPVARDQTDLKIQVEQWKLKTEFDDERVVHIIHRSSLGIKQQITKIEETWTMKSKIGQGGFGTVWLQVEAKGKLRAVKKVAKSSTWEWASKQMAGMMETKILLELTEYEHLFVQFHGWYEDKQYIFLAMEYGAYGDLGDHIKARNSRLDAREITKQILEGLEVLHKKKICHRDIKPQNILIFGLRPIWVKIADFGVSKIEEDTILRTRVGTYLYMAPEVRGIIKRKWRASSHTNAIDIWSLGCVVYELMTSKLPFEGIVIRDSSDTNTQVGTCESPPFTSSTGSDPMNIRALYSYCDNKIPFPTKELRKSGVSTKGVNFVKGLLAAKPSCRMTAGEALNSEWLVEEDQSTTEETIDICLMPQIDQVIIPDLQVS